MFSYDEKTGCVTELTAGGTRRFNRREAGELFELEHLVREHGRGSPQVVISWLTAGGGERALEPLLRDELRARGYDADCALCKAGAGRRHLSTAKAKRRYGILASRTTLAQHRRHARRRPYKPGEGRPESVPAPWERPTKKKKVVPPEPAEPPWQD